MEDILDIVGWSIQCETFAETIAGLLTPEMAREFIYPGAKKVAGMLVVGLEPVEMVATGLDLLTQVFLIPIHLYSVV